MKNYLGTCPYDISGIQSKLYREFEIPIIKK